MARVREELALLSHGLKGGVARAFELNRLAFELASLIHRQAACLEDLGETSAELTFRDFTRTDFGLEFGALTEEGADQGGDLAELVPRRKGVEGPGLIRLQARGDGLEGARNPTIEAERKRPEKEGGIGKVPNDAARRGLVEQAPSRSLRGDHGVLDGFAIESGQREAGEEQALGHLVGRDVRVRGERDPRVGHLLKLAEKAPGPHPADEEVPGGPTKKYPEGTVFRSRSVVPWTVEPRISSGPRLV